MLKNSDINIRDPFILLDEGKYYMYGTRGAECWGEGKGLDVYVSDDLENWTEPTEVFSRPEGFWADRNFWAPEVHKYRGSYYMFVTFKSETACRGTQILKADSPMGPFLLHSDGPVTPRDWECLDGTLFIEDGKPYMVFCHEWIQVEDGEMCAVELTEDLRAAVGEPKLLFRAAEPGWSTGMSDGGYVTDGPFLHQMEDGSHIMVWSSFAAGGYCEAIARMKEETLLGAWEHEEKLLFEKDGGHGMLFTDKEGSLRFVCHQPNTTLCERPVFFTVREKGNTLEVVDNDGQNI